MPSIANDSGQSVIRITDHLEQVQRRVAKACENAGRSPAGVRILAVSKQQPAALIRAARAAGQRAFGENYLQEALPKIRSLADSAIEWHFIGAVQSNKSRAIAEHFAWLHTVDRERIAARLNDQRPDSLPPLNICLQVRLTEDTSRSGVAPEGLPALAAMVAAQPHLKLRGLMGMPPLTPEPEGARPYFKKLHTLYQQLRAGGFDLDTLSMGMSADLEVAISERATMVRIGTAIFGPRPTISDKG